MSDDGESILGNPGATGEEIRRAMAQAINEALSDHIRTGDPIAVWDWETERVRIIPPEEVHTSEDDEIRTEVIAGGKGSKA